MIRSVNLYLTLEKVRPGCDVAAVIYTLRAGQKQGGTEWLFVAKNVVTTNAVMDERYSCSGSTATI